MTDFCNRFCIYPFSLYLHIQNMEIKSLSVHLLPYLYLPVTLIVAETIFTFNEI